MLRIRWYGISPSEMLRSYIRNHIELNIMSISLMFERSFLHSFYSNLLARVVQLRWSNEFQTFIVRSSFSLCSAHFIIFLFMCEKFFLKHDSNNDAPSLSNYYESEFYFHHQHAILQCFFSFPKWIHSILTTWYFIY